MYNRQSDPVTPVRPGSPRRRPNPLRVVPAPAPAPANLQFLVKAHQVSTGAALVLTALLVGAYAVTVRIQQEWGKTYHQLTTLQRQELELTTTSQQLRYTLGNQAAAAGLVPANPSQAVFLKTTPSPVVTPSPASTPQAAPPPLAY